MSDDPEPVRARPDRTAPDAGSDGLDRRLRHDIRHELATIGLLASLLATADDIGATSRTRASQLLRETRWLAELLQAYEDARPGGGAPWPTPVEPLRVDVLVGEVVATLRLTHPTEIHFVPAESWTCGNRLALWRVLRNVLENALRAAGPRGRVQVRAGTADGWAVVQVDDDGPGFGRGPHGLAHLGLRIVRDIVAEYGGGVVTTGSDLGGARVRLLLPAVPPPDPAHPSPATRLGEDPACAS
ncbi:MAG TPA: HAMP domain-containing sensor histidine kinase [Micromonosporaceae bacterium]